MLLLKEVTVAQDILNFENGLLGFSTGACAKSLSAKVGEKPKDDGKDHDKKEHGKGHGKGKGGGGGSDDEASS